jgi:hypothetical protein
MKSTNYAWPPLSFNFNCLLNTLFWNSLSLFAFSERPCFTSIKWYNCLKYNFHNKFIYHNFSNWRGPLRCRLFAGDSVDTWGNIQVPLCTGLSLQCGGSVVALYSWQMPVSGWETKTIHNSGNLISTPHFLSSPLLVFSFFGWGGGGGHCSKICS